MAKYIAHIGDQKKLIEIPNDGRPTVEGRYLDLDLERIIARLIDEKSGETSARIFIEKIGLSSYRVWMKHRSYEVIIEDEIQKYISQVSGSGSKQDVSHRITAPMPGLVSRIEVEVGDRVQKGRGLLVLEAMKMENELKSPVDGVVKEIFVTSRAGVEKGELLMTLEIV